ncbi:hypothetical protein PLICRDRAFT_617803, partial [Plicaturopsis crispa FD-325 SS-3]
MDGLTFLLCVSATACCLSTRLAAVHSTSRFHAAPPPPPSSLEVIIQCDYTVAVPLASSRCTSPESSVLDLRYEFRCPPLWDLGASSPALR